MMVPFSAVSKEGAHILVSGTVQGVGYRAWTDRTARELGLTGWVRNLYDGRVEILAEAEREVLDDFIERCKRGPRYAQVDNVVVRKTGATDAPSFTIQRDASEVMK